MNQCPDCHNFIHYLIVRKMKGKVLIMEEGKMKLQPNMVSKDGISKVDNKYFITHYSCPVCEYTLFEDNEIEARYWIEKIM